MGGLGCQNLLVSGGSDGLLVVWGAEQQGGTGVVREIGPKINVPKAHDGGVYDIRLVRIIGSAPQLVTSGADKTVALWDTLQFREVRRLKPVPKLAVNSVASWHHPRASSVQVLATVKGSQLWAIGPSGSFCTPLCDFLPMIPPTPQLAAGKKLKIYCMMPHPLQPHILVVGTNMGVILSEYAPRATPPAVPLPSPSDSREHAVIYAVNRALHAVKFQLAGQGQGGREGAGGGGGGVEQTPAGLSLLAAGPRGRADSADASTPQIRQSRVQLGVTPHDGAAVLALSKSGRYVSVVWPDVASYGVYRTHDWTVVEVGEASHLAWDICQDRYAVLHAKPVRPFVASSSSSFRGPIRSSKKKEALEREHRDQMATMAAAEALGGGSAPEIKKISDSGIAFTICPALTGGLKEAVGALHGGALLGVAYRTSQRMDSASLAAASAVSATLGRGSLSGLAPGEAGHRPPASDALANFLLFSWETFAPVSPPMPAPLWTAWDPSVEHCALVYSNYIVIAALRPHFRYLGNVAIPAATGGVWHRRQLFLATRSTIECVFVDAGVSVTDIEQTKLKKRRAEAKAVFEKGELAMLTAVSEGGDEKEEVSERIQLRPPMLQVVRLASFQSAPAVPPIAALVKVRSEAEERGGGLLDGPEKAPPPEVVIGGGGVSVAPTRLPIEQRRPVGPLTVVGVRDGVLWLMDRYMTAHAIGLSHPGIRCRCLSAYGDPVGAVKWASKLGREHHDDLASFMVGMGQAAEALYLQGISKRFEYDLAIQTGQLARALSCLQILSTGGKGGGGGDGGLEGGQGGEITPDSTGVLALAATQHRTVEGAAGVARFASEYLELIDAADASGQSDIAGLALRRLAGAGLVGGALSEEQLRALTLRLATHGEGMRLQMQSAAMVRAAEGQLAALAAALLGDANALEKAWQDTGMLPLASLHAQAHGRPSIQVLLKQWNRLLQKDQTYASSGQAQHLQHYGGLMGTPKSDTSSLSQFTLKGKQPMLEVHPPKNFATAQDIGQPVLGTAGLAVSAGLGPLMAGGGVQGLKQPLDLTVLEGGGKGPAPQKGPPRIAVPLDFSLFEKKKEAEVVSVDLQPAPLQNLPPSSVGRGGKEAGGGAKAFSAQATDLFLEENFIPAREVKSVKENGKGSKGVGGVGGGVRGSVEEEGMVGLNGEAEKSTNDLAQHSPKAGTPTSKTSRGRKFFGFLGSS